MMTWENISGNAVSEENLLEMAKEENLPIPPLPPNAKTFIFFIYPPRKTNDWFA